MAKRVRKMRAVASLSKDSLPQKRKAPIEVAPVQSDQDEQTNSDLVFKRGERRFLLLNTPTRIAELHTRRSFPSKSVRPKTHAEKAYVM